MYILQSTFEGFPKRIMDQFRINDQESEAASVSKHASNSGFVNISQPYQKCAQVMNLRTNQSGHFLGWSAPQTQLSGLPGHRAEAAVAQASAHPVDVLKLPAHRRRPFVSHPARAVPRGAHARSATRRRYMRGRRCWTVLDGAGCVDVRPPWIAPVPREVDALGVKRKNGDRLSGKWVLSKTE